MSSGRRTASAFAARAASIRSTTRAALPSMSPTTLFVWASASLIGFRLSVENCISAALCGAPAPPVDVEKHRGEERRERQPADPRAVGLLADHAEDGRHHEQADHPRTYLLRAH